MAKGDCPLCDWMHCIYPVNLPLIFYLCARRTPKHIYHGIQNSGEVHFSQCVLHLWSSSSWKLTEQSILCTPFSVYRDLPFCFCNFWSHGWHIQLLQCVNHMIAPLVRHSVVNRAVTAMHSFRLWESFKYDISFHGTRWAGPVFKAIVLWRWLH